MIQKRWRLALLALLAAGLVMGCGNNFRQFIAPVPPPAGDPKGQNGQPEAVVLSTNPAGDGTDTHFNVSGDTTSGIVALGVNPVFLGKAPGRVFVINGDNTVATYASIVNVAASGTPQINTAVLPAGISGPVAGGAGSSGNIYIADSGSNDVTVINGATFTASLIIPVGTQPVAVAGGASTKVYVVNQGSNNVTAISSLDNQVVTTIPVGVQPIWAVMSTDGLHVFVVNQGDGTVSTIDTQTDQVIATIPVGAAPNFAFFDPALQRLYVTNTGASSVSIIKTDGINTTATPPVLPVKLADVAVSGSPTSVTVLPDGSKAYAALGNCPAGVNHTTLLGLLSAGSCPGNQVSVIDTLGLRESRVIALPPESQPSTFTETIAGTVAIDASFDGSRVYVLHAGDQIVVPDVVSGSPSRVIPAGSISIIRTSTDTEITDLSGNIFRFHAPPQDPACAPAVIAGFNPNGPIPCPLQSPFAIRMVP